MAADMKTTTKKNTNVDNSDIKSKSALRKLQPTAQMPVGQVMRRMSAADAQRLRSRLTSLLECVYDDRFRRAGAEKKFIPGGIDGFIEERRKAVPKIHTADNPPKALTKDEEEELFLRFNYTRHRLMRILRSFRSKRLTARATRELLKWDEAMLFVRDDIVQANLGLVPSMVERRKLTGVDFGELISEGQLALLRSVDKFDCSRGFKFSTYACRAIITSISRAVAMMSQHRARFPTEYDPDLQKSDFVELRREDTEDHCVTELDRMLKHNSAELTQTELKVLSERFGVNTKQKKPDGKVKTLRQVAEVFGVTKERVRQIQNKALLKLRSAIEGEVLA